MSRSIFLFIASMLLLLPFVLNAGEISASHQLFICTPLILFLGIPHGAIDNVLFIRNKEIKNYEFIGIYLVFVSLNVGLWIIFPSLGYILFLLLSAYHFGQSQFSHYFERQPLSHLSLYLFWGISILSGLVYFNIEEIQQIMSNQAEFAVFSPLHQENHMLYTLLFSTGVTLLLMVFLTLKGSIRFETFFMEFLVLSLIQICYFLMPLLIGFTLYFVLLHSFKVLREEYLFLNSENEVKSLGNFIKLVTPFTLFSIVGIAFLFGLIYLNILTLPYGYVLLIVISSITLPHVFVMNRFYSLLFSKRLSSKVIKA